MNGEGIPFDFFKDFTEEEQNCFLQEYLTQTTKFLKKYEFPNSPKCYYYRNQFFDDKYHGNSSSNLSWLLLLLIKRCFLLPIRFLNNRTIPGIKTPMVYFIFSNWPVGNLDDKDFEAFEHVQDYELMEYANMVLN